jgi:hypothetical protein
MTHCGPRAVRLPTNGESERPYHAMAMGAESLQARPLGISLWHHFTIYREMRIGPLAIITVAFLGWCADLPPTASGLGISRAGPAPTTSAARCLPARPGAAIADPIPKDAGLKAAVFVDAGNVWSYQGLTTFVPPIFPNALCGQAATQATATGRRIPPNRAWRPAPA